MLKNMFQNSFNHSCFKMASFIRPPVLIPLPKMEWLNVVSTTCFFINQKTSSILNWDTPYHIFFPNKPLFPIEPWIFGCTYFVRDVHLRGSKLDPKSLKCIFLVILGV